MKQCSKCKKNKVESAFNKNSATKDGLQNLCRSCDNQKSRRYHINNSNGIQARMRQNRIDRKLFLQSTFGTACMKCGSTEQLEFHHRDPSTKLFNIGTSWRLDIERVINEIAKCDLLCFKCHRGEMKHGTNSMYVGGKCRCKPCSEAHRQYHKNYRAKGHN